MALSRRRFLLTTAAAAGALPFGCGRSTAAATPAATFRVNHVGYRIDAAKFVLCAGAATRSVAVRREGVDAAVLRATTAVAPEELGAFTVADLSAIREAGVYTLSAAGLVDATLLVADDPYREAIASALNYFRVQRCGHPTLGHHAPCHLDDGRRSDDGAHQDASGGWHDACDLRKWVDATIYGVIGLARGLEALGAAHPNRAAALDEIRWGNAYFLKMQRPDGAVMRWCGGNRDGNRYTDNRPGDADDRVLDVEPAELFGQHLFAAAQALVARLFASSDGAYAKRCVEAASRCMAWCAARSPGTCLSVATGASAAALLATVDRTSERAAAARDLGQVLLRLQVPGGSGGWFRARLDGDESYRDAQHGDAPLLALCDLLESLPDHADAGRWRDALRDHADHLERMAARSAFGIAPYGIYPGDGRRLGELRYRWFMKQRGETPDPEWWVGSSAHVASVGVGMRRAARLLESAKLSASAQRHLDWLIGTNPFDASMITGIGRNQPRLYRAGTFDPPTPAIAGGVVNGIGGDDADRPTLLDGSWQTCEYWTPNVAHTHWLLAIL